jgi:hypothetical protein
VRLKSQQWKSLKSFSLNGKQKELKKSMRPIQVHEEGRKWVENHFHFDVPEVAQAISNQTQFL